MKRFTTSIRAQSIYYPHLTVEKVYQVDAASKHQAEIETLNMFWKEVDMFSYSFLAQDIEEVN